jgi:TRAP-type C4-dicarboxylate transport system substrate-binding protein
MFVKALAPVLAAALLCSSAVAAEPIVLKLTSPAPPSSYLHPEAFTPWANAVTQASNGTLKVETYFGGTLGNFGVTYDRVVDGVADVGFILTSFAAGKFKQQDVAALPFEAKSALEASTALWEIYEKGITVEEFDVVRPLAIWTFPNSALHSRTPVKTLADLKGKKITTSNVIAGKMVVALGAAQVTFRPDETYQALSRGIADMALMPFTGMATFKINEVSKYHLDAALGSDSALLFISRKRYDSLPPEAKAAIDKNSYLPLSQKLGRLTDQQWAEKRDMVKATVTTLTPQEEARWKKAVDPIAAAWAKDTPNGARVLGNFRASVAAFEKSQAKGGKK